MRAAFPVTDPFRPKQPGDSSLLPERFRAAGFTEKSVSEVLEGKSDRNIDNILTHAPNEQAPRRQDIRCS